MNVISKLSDLELRVKELQTAAQYLISAAESLTALFSNSISESNEPEPPNAAAVTLEQVRGVLAEKSREGHTEAVRGLLIKHGGSKLSEISPDCYASLLKDAEVLGNE